MKNLFLAAGLAAFAIGACNTATRDGVSRTDDMNRDQTTTTTADRGNMPSSGTTAPGENNRTDMDRTDVDRADMNPTVRDGEVTDETMSARSDRPVGYESDDATDPQGVIEAVNEAGGLTKLPKDVANRVIDGYIAKLTGEPRAAGIVTDLALLRKEINSGFIDRGAVGAALNRLGAQTRVLAGEGSPYNAIATALEMSGKQLVGDKTTD